jgi:hypothetical protein
MSHEHSTSPADGDSLPALVRDYAHRALPADRPAYRSVRIRQAGEMVLRPGAAPRRFQATEQLAVARVAFAWRARFFIFGPLALYVTDGYDGHDGRLQVRVLGLPVQRKRGAELALGEAFRYLAEIAWVPHAILANRQLEWHAVDERTVEVSTRVRGDRAAVRLTFNGDGDLVRTEADRPRLEADNAIVPWTGS